MSPERRVIVTRRELTATKGVDIPTAEAMLRAMNAFLYEGIKGLAFRLLYSNDKKHVALGIIMEDEGMPTPVRKIKRSKETETSPIDSAPPERTPISTQDDPSSKIRAR